MNSDKIDNITRDINDTLTVSSSDLSLLCNSFFKKKKKKKKKKTLTLF